ncbi:phosphoribosylformylglycinamidine synthase subunit PurL [Candidatus Woesearchaeota archaeon]|nr:phosphoribosylformylglycinamidine synthase subunit PurL [Candidatus Woesearchaeota archaeon]
MASKVDVELVPLNTFSDADLASFLRKNGLALKPEEAKKAASLIGRNPTITELHIFNIQWSEHSSYKSSRNILKMLPTSAPNVILGPKEDAGIVEFATIDCEKYGIVISHESHNHPSQVVPYEGAATGVGGNIRDVACMGAKVIASADPLRFGDLHGQNKNKTKYIANEVINGIAGYGNPLGIPILAGDIYSNSSFDENCLVNVVCLGIIKEKDIIHSAAPPHAEGYDIIVVGKATDNSGFGGAAFASLILDEKDEQSNKGAVQVPDPFLKNILLRATYAVFEEARKKNIILGFKDMGAGGIMCATSELCDAGGYGCTLDLDKVHVSMDNLPPYIIACGETQERFTWISPPSFTKTILRIYNENFALPTIAEHAQASVVGKVTKEKDYILTHNGNVVCNAPVDVITSGIRYDREKKESKRDLNEPQLPEPSDYAQEILSVLRHPNVASKKCVYDRYDTHVLGLTIIPPGQADAGLMAPLHGKKPGVALSVDCNPRYNRISPYWGAANAVAESMRNVAAIGAVPSALTDCLNYGNPEIPEVFHDFCEGVRGIADAASKLFYKGTTNPVPVISGNVSFYNESKKGKAIDPSPIIACVGVMPDYSKAITMKLKKAGSILVLLGKRKDELGGSVYYDVHGKLGKNVPLVDFEDERNHIYTIIDAIDKRLLLSCHDISDGGMIAAVAEMMLGADADGAIGAELVLKSSKLSLSKALFSESSGFVAEVAQENLDALRVVGKKYGTEIFIIGKTTTEQKLKINDEIILSIPEMARAWSNGFKEAMR